jgi:hypothetical protein
MKIRKYVKQRNVAQLPKSVQNIISSQQDEAGKYETNAEENLEKAIIEAECYVDGEHIEVKAGSAKAKLDQSLEYLVSHVYSELNLIAENAESDADVIAILNGTANYIQGAEPNRDAAAKVEEYLEVQDRKHLPTSMADVQSRYQAIPYGWKEIDIAAVCALLIYNQKVTIKYAGATIQPNNPKLPDMLRKKSEIGKTQISKRHVVSAARMKAARDLLRDYFNLMDVPADEDGLILFITEKFKNLQEHYNSLFAKYDDKHKYPDKNVVIQAVAVVEDVLSQQKDNVALIERLLAREDNLYDAQEAMQNVESFFKTQVSVFDEAVRFDLNLRNDLDYIKKDEEADNALKQIRVITMIPANGKYDYKRIPELNGLMAKVKASHDAMLEEKRKELVEVVEQCMGEVHRAAGGDHSAKAVIERADVYYTQQKEKIAKTESLALMEGYPIPMWNYRDDAVSKIEAALMPPEPTVKPKSDETPKAVSKKNYKPIFRQSLLKATTLESEADIDAYVDKLREQLKILLKGTDGIELK